jgi:hypothetical protein
MGRRILIALALAISHAQPAAASLSFSSDHRAVFFGVMELGETKELAQSGSYQNQVTVSSSNGQAWYLKIHVMQPLSSGRHQIPLDRFQWQLSATSGHGTIQRRHEFTPFRASPDLVYISGADEASSRPVDFQFSYRIQLPEAQAAGVYHTTIRSTLSEIL